MRGSVATSELCFVALVLPISALSVSYIKTQHTLRFHLVPPTPTSSSLSVRDRAHPGSDRNNRRIEDLLIYPNLTDIQTVARVAHGGVRY